MTAAAPTHLKILYEKQHGLCWFCDRPMVLIDVEPGPSLPRAATVDHLRPISRGGRNDFENKVAACWRCNNEKGNLTEEEYRRLRRDKREMRRWKARLCEVRRQEFRYRG